ncbi:hypothetical protein PBI_DEWDROP_20 [Microbacterium phage Dewdrop]|nr:hypothetical protein PBI_LEAF_20 [Microbacterium phage Leaf]QGZ17389.1 hypothetical protein PBI_DEWDROP_20 [Microbacterium phage Dewdrop]
MFTAAAEACEVTSFPDAIIMATLIVAGAAVAIVFIWRVLS